MLTPEQIQEFNEKGYIKGDIVLSDEQVEKLREELQLVMDGKSVKKPVLNRDLYGESDKPMTGMQMTQSDTVVQIVNMWMASEAFFDHACTEKICEEVAQLLDTDTVRIWHDQVQYKPPVTGGPTLWHQDHPAWPIIQPADLISAWVALDDAVIENGCMWMVPGSHKWGDQQPYLKTDDNYMPVHSKPELLPEGVDTTPVPFTIKKGQVGYHHCMTWHGATTNRSDLKRRAIAVHYMPAHTRYEPTGHHPMEDHIGNVKPGEILQGDDFPVVYERKTVKA